MLLLMTNRNLHCICAFDWHQGDDLGRPWMLYVWIFSEFRVISQMWEATTAKRMMIDLYCQWCIDYVDILLGVPPLGVYNRNTVGESGDFQPVHPKISRSSQTGSNRPRLLLTINWKYAADFFARGLHTRTAVARLPLRQLGFLVNCRSCSSF